MPGIAMMAMNAGKAREALKLFTNTSAVTSRLYHSQSIATPVISRHSTSPIPNRPVRIQKKHALEAKLQAESACLNKTVLDCMFACKHARSPTAWHDSLGKNKLFIRDQKSVVAAMITHRAI